MRFAALSYVHLLWLLPALLALYAYGFARKRRALSVFIDPGVAPRLTGDLRPTRRWLKALCLLGAVAAMIVALAQPQWGRRWQEVQRRGRDVMIVLDVSRSMLAEDVSPNRLERAKVDIRELVQVMREEEGHRLGLVVFAGRASLQCPLTLDTSFFLRRLAEVGPHTAGRGGSMLGDAIRHALRGMATLAHHYKDIILITDGDDHDIGGKHPAIGGRDAFDPPPALERGDLDAGHDGDTVAGVRRVVRTARRAHRRRRR